MIKIINKKTKKLLYFLILSISFVPASIGHQIKNVTGEETKENFMINSLRALSERSGNIFAIPKKNNITMGDYSHDGFSHIKQNGKIIKVENRGTGHGSPWDYDTKIPIIMYGEGFINSGKIVDRFATQQDIVNTYSYILNTEPPVDAEGSVLSESLIKTNKKPKVIMTILLDQVGESFYQVHLNSFPQIKKIRNKGTYFTNAKVTHLESETTVGHVAVGTGAYPDKHGMPSNSFYLKGLGKTTYPFSLDKEQSPVWLKSPSFSDVYDLATDNKAIIVSYCFAERASIGMAGHGSMYNKGDKDIVFYYSDLEDKFVTNENYFSLPSYLKEFKAKPYIDKLTKNTGLWMEHKIPVNEPFKKPWEEKSRVENKSTMTPAFSKLEGDMITRLIKEEKIGDDDVTDLIYITFKATDYCAHSYGFESEECRNVFEETDNQIGIIVNELEKKVGKDNYILTISADHGGTPLVELTGGTRLIEGDMKDLLNKKFDNLKNKIDVIDNIGHIQITVNEDELKRNGYKLNDIKDFLLNYKINNKNYYEYVFTKDELLEFSFNKK